METEKKRSNTYLKHKNTPARNEKKAKTALPYIERLQKSQSEKGNTHLSVETVNSTSAFASQRENPVSESKIDELLRSKSETTAKPKVKYHRPDAIFLMLVLGLLCFGLVMMYSSSYAWSINDYGTPFKYINQQLVATAIGMAALLFLTYFFDYKNLKFWTPFYFVAIFILLIMVFIMGTTAGGAQRWINIGGQSVQPSEFAKLAVIWMLAWIYSIAGNRIKTFTWGILPLFGTLILILPFLLAQKHISAITLVTLTAVIMCFIGGASAFWLGGLSIGGIISVYVAVTKISSFSYVLARLSIWKNPFTDPQGLGYQTIQSIYAISSGGIFGLGLGQSRQKQLYLPAAHNDYVFSIVCEELGLVGAVILIGLFVALIVRGYYIAIHAADKFGSLLVTGITTIIALQTFMNIAVVTNAMPVTGVSLPFFSYGGSSLIVQLIMMGMVLGVSRQMRTEKE